jgi:hypothetical protein
MPQESALKLKLPKDIEQDIHLALCRRVSDMEMAASRRNSDLREYRDQLEGLNAPADNGGDGTGVKKMRGGSELCDPLTLELTISLLASFMQANARSTKVAFYAINPEDEQNSQSIEQWVVAKWSEYDLDKQYFDAAYNALTKPSSPCYVGWKQEVRPVRSSMYRKPGTEQLVEEELQEDGIFYEEVPVTKTEVVYDGIDFRVIDLDDFYLYPSTAPTPKDATTIAERFYVTAEQLLDGIDDYGYDEEAVYKLLEYPPSARTDNKQNVDQQEGIESGNASDGMYELFSLYTRMPRLLDSSGAKDRVPKYLWHDRFIAVLSADSNLVLNLDFAVHRECPYFQSYMLRKPGRNQGHFVNQMLDSIQAEINAEIRFGIDSMNLTSCPAQYVEETDGSNLNKYEIFPGAMIPVRNINGIKPVDWNRSGGREQLAYTQYLQSRAQALVSSDGSSRLSQKVRKNQEIEAVEQAKQSKFGLFLSQFNESFLCEAARRLLSVTLEQGNMEDDGETFILDGKPHTVTQQALKGRYLIVPTATSSTASPEARIAISEQKKKFSDEYILAKAKGVPPDDLKYLWHSTRQVLLALEEPYPEAWIGDEPQPPPPGEGLPQAPQQGQEQQGGGQPQQGQPPLALVQGGQQ